MAEHLNAWIVGKPLRYRMIALLVGARTEASLEIEPGIHVEMLSTNTKELPQSVPGLGSVAPATYQAWREHPSASVTARLSGA